MRWLVACSLACSAGCVQSTQDFASRDLGALPRDKLVLVGTVRVFDHGVDQTGRTAIEVTGGTRGFSLPESGEVVWVVDRPPPGKPLRLIWISTLDDIRSFDDGVVLARADLAEPCSYFGTLTLQLTAPGQKEELSQAVVGMSQAGGQSTHEDDYPAELERFRQKYPNLAKVDCDPVLRRGARRK